MADKNWNDAFDEMLAKLNNGDFVDQSVHEFEKTVNKTTKTSTSSRYTASTYKTVVPHVNRTIENSNYAFRHLYLKKCLENIVYDKYPSSKRDGFDKCIERYKDEVEEHANNLKPVEQEIENDLKEYKEKVNNVTVDGFLQGYYDALQLIKKLLYTSKIAKLQEITNKVSR